MVHLLTTEQANELIGIEYAKGIFFNPIQDIDDNWVITDYEVETCTIDWVKQTPQIEFKPKERIL